MTDPIVTTQPDDNGVNTIVGQVNALQGTEFYNGALMSAQALAATGHAAYVPSAASPFQYLYNNEAVYDRATNTYVVSTNIDTASLNSLINTAHDHSTVQFEAGTYTLTGLVEVTRGDITLQGMGEDKTVFNAILSTGNTAAFQTALGHSIFEFSSSFGDNSTLAAAAHAADTSIQVADGTKFKAGQEIQISEGNDDAYINTPAAGEFSEQSLSVADQPGHL